MKEARSSRSFHGVPGAVLPTWGSMVPGVPPKGYGDMSFDPTNLSEPKRHGFKPAPKTFQDELVRRVRSRKSSSRKA